MSATGRFLFFIFELSAHWKPAQRKVIVEANTIHLLLLCAIGLSAMWNGSDPGCQIFWYFEPGEIHNQAAMPASLNGQV
jgi:hypothetical protein